MARTGARHDNRPELTCFLVEHGTPGFEAREMHQKLMWRGSNTSELYFEDCRVPEKNILGKKGAGFHQMLETLDAGRLSIGAMGVGGAQGAYDLAMGYAKQREQFGRAISSFQVNAFKLADMALEIEAARLLLYKACWLKDNHKNFSKHAAMAKLFASEVMGLVAAEAVQLHGGYGLMKEYDVERFFRDQKLLTIGEGTSEIQRLVIARLIGVI
jgi:alkylation response protein AidB-like acyl-CoA dehydrogenase